LLVWHGPVPNAPTGQMVAEVFGLEVGELPEGWQPVEALCIVRCVAFADDEGGTAAQKLSMRATEGLTIWEVMGMLTGYLADAKQQFLGTLLDEDGNP
jgi:hypothetical protein